MKKLFIILLIIILAGAGAWYWLFNDHKSPEPQVTGVEVAVKRGPMEKVVVSTGTVKPQVGAEVKVGARVSGRVEKLLVSVGQQVSAGQVVAVIEHRDLQAKVDQVKAELNEVRIQLAQARVDHKRRQTLRTGDLVSQEALEKAGREEAVLLARENSAKARLTTTEIQRGYATIKAPIAGVVASISTQQGETVAASMSAPTFINIVDLSRLQVEDYVDETDVGMVRSGLTAYFIVDAFAGRRFQGKVQAVSPSAQIIDNVVYYPVDIHIVDDYQGLLKPEMTATVSIIIDTHSQALWLPADAVRRRQGKSFVYLKTGSNLKRVQVKPGWSQEGRVEILSGLEEGQTVIIPSGPPPVAPFPRH